MLAGIARTTCRLAAQKFADVAVATVGRTVDWCVTARADYRALCADIDRHRNGRDA